MSLGSEYSIAPMGSDIKVNCLRVKTGFEGIDLKSLTFLSLPLGILFAFNNKEYAAQNRKKKNYLIFLSECNILR